MTLEEAIKNIKEQMDLYVWQLEDINKVVEPRRYEQYRLAIMSFEMAIKALEQQPCEDASDNTYQIRYKNWHDNELPTDFVKDDILHTPDEAYNRGLNDAWNLAKKIVLPEDKGGYTADELEDIFGKSAFTTLTAQEALAKVKAYGEESEILSQPSVTSQQKIGYWTRELILNEYGGCIGAKMICSECGQDNGYDKRMKFCPNCGTKMEVGEC